MLGTTRDTVSLSGEYDAGGWFAAEAALHADPPSMSAGPLAAFGHDPGEQSVRDDEPVELTWSPPAGGADRYDVAYSLDHGLRWSVFASGRATQVAFVAPDTSSGALVEVVALRGDAVAATWLSAPFVVLPGASDGLPGTPARFALKLKSATPSSDGARFSLELPGAGAADVSVYDVRGARVARLAHGTLPAGRHAVVWNGLRSDGSRAAPGIYLVRAEHPTGSATLRIIALR